MKTIIIHVGTNNIPRDQPLNIANALLDLVMLIRGKSPAHIILTGILPRGEARYRKKILEVNYHVETILQNSDLCDFLKPNEDWLFPNRTLNLSCFISVKNAIRNLPGISKNIYLLFLLPLHLFLCQCLHFLCVPLPPYTLVFFLFLPQLKWLLLHNAVVIGNNPRIPDLHHFNIPRISNL